MSGYIGSTPVPQATQHRESFTCTEGQTSFASAGYTPQFLDVFLNGSHLSPADFTATNGSDVVLVSGARADDVCDIISYSAFEINAQVFTGDFTVDGTTLSVDSTNNRVGVGTGSPTRPLHVFTPGQTEDGIIKVGGSAASLGLEISYDQSSDTTTKIISNPTYTSANSLMHIAVDGDANPDQLVLKGNGNVGVGTTSPGRLLEINNATNPALRLNNGNSNVDIGVASSAGAMLTGAADDDLVIARNGAFGISVGTNGVTRLKIDATGAVTKPLQPAFLVQPATQQSNISADGNLNVVVFGTERFDQNADFGSNVFTAPVAGKYHFDVNLFLLNLDSAAAYYSIRLITNNRTYFYEFDPDFGQDATRFNLSFSVLADMAATHTAGVQILQVQGTSQTDIAVESYFSGHLVA